LGHLSTADKIPEPSVEARAHKLKAFEPLAPLEVESWGKRMPSLQRAFSIVAPHAVYIASIERPVVVGLADRDDGIERWYGGDPTLVTTDEGAKPLSEVGRWERIKGRYVGNRSKGCWPIQLGLTGLHRDAVSWALPRDAFTHWAMRYRVWTMDADAALRLHDEVWRRWRARSLDRGGEDLPHGFIDAGPGFKPHLAASESIVPLAREMGIWAKLEVDLKKFLLHAMHKAGVHGADDDSGWARFRATALAMIDKEMEGAHALSGQGGGVVERSGGLPARGYMARKMPPAEAEAYERWRQEMAQIRLHGE
jgi:hypothetical protein